ncbi:TonB-dependent receptor [Daejeonella oryzae]|uniref:TonB-dependent receptor n=1 Tax=Daejeonella oryzae TaxID=1122943 RepID=UPI0004128768|nr:TonB-dependent receptor [Daejeonella oryzae]
MIRTLLFILAGWVFLQLPLRAQTADSIKPLSEVLIQGYLSDQNLLKTPSAAAVIDQIQIKKQAGNSFIPVLNTIPGVRMEERSPGSYRLSIRGTLLRSPFGIRNLKVYMDQYPLTDAGGNTYLNLIDINSVSEIEILKGPDGSLFGANSGGVVLLKTMNKSTDSLSVSAGLQGGSFGLIRQNAEVLKQSEKYQLKLNEAWQKSNGYRDHSSLDRKYIQASQRWSYQPGMEFRSVIFYSDLNYLTPGGLTATQYQDNPRSARPATAFLPGAADQKAGIHNKTLFGGLLHETKISNSLRHVAAVFGSFTDFKNPFISNYEIRDENNLGFRSYLELASNRSGLIKPKLHLGLEVQQSNSDIANYGNRGGIKDTLQSADRLKAFQHFYFSRFSAEISNRFIFEAALSLNYFKYNFNAGQQSTDLLNRKFDPQLMPRIAISYLANANLTLRSSLSKGFSPPALAEIRSSNQVINSNLEAESGWNYESGLRLKSTDDRFRLDLSAYYYRLENAIVRRVDDSDDDYFVNAGGTNQYGLELEIQGWLIKHNQTKLIRSLQVTSSITLNKYRLYNYSVGSDTYSGNSLTGVPGYIHYTSLSIDMPSDFNVFAQHTYNGRIPLNDANTFYSEKYNLVQIKTGYKINLKSGSQLQIYAGADNLLNERYSPGSDLNAFGGRFYNAAPGRNFYAGLQVKF